MAYKVCIREVAEAAGVKNAYQLGKRLGLYAPSAATRVWNSDGWTRIDLKTLEKVCEAFGVTPNDVIREVRIKKPRSSKSGELKSS